jgi:hypothetical protein
MGIRKFGANGVSGGGVEKNLIVMLLHKDKNECKNNSPKDVTSQHQQYRN